jgi:uncharacterized protein (DUF1330 family)
MTAYAIAHLQEASPHPEIAEYIERISGTFEPYGGRFLVHGMQHEVKEGTWPGHVVMIGFPGIDEARAWWNSPEYQEIAPLRSSTSPCGATSGSALASQSAATQNASQHR